MSKKAEHCPRGQKIWDELSNDMRSDLLDADDIASHDDIIAWLDKASQREILERWLSYVGVIGYAGSIIRLIEASNQETMP